MSSGTLTQHNAGTIFLNAHERTTHLGNAQCRRTHRQDGKGFCPQEPRQHGYSSKVVALSHQAQALEPIRDE